MDAACFANGKEGRFVFTRKFSSVIRHLGQRSSRAAVGPRREAGAGRLDAALQQPSIPGPETWPRRYRAFKVSLSEGNGLPWWDGERGEDKISEDKQAR